VELAPHNQDQRESEKQAGKTIANTNEGGRRNRLRQSSVDKSFRPQWQGTDDTPERVDDR
jgi:hypothetical protein